AIEIRAKVAPQVMADASRRRRIDPVAEEAYLKGRYHLNQGGEESLRTSASRFGRHGRLSGILVSGQSVDRIFVRQVLRYSRRVRSGENPGRRGHAHHAHEAAGTIPAGLLELRR